MILRLLCLFLLFCSCSVNALNIFDLKQAPLPMSQAYVFSAHREADQIIAHWSMPKGYYLYQDRFCFALNGQAVQPLALPPAEIHQDPLLGQFKAYANQVNIALAIPAGMKHQPINLHVCYQGCSRDHFCYPPTTQTLSLLPDNTSVQYASTFAVSSVTAPPLPLNTQDRLTHLLTGHHFSFALLTFFGMGLLLAFTPCVLPMLPILASLIVGQQNKRSLQAVLVAGTYVLSMSLTYGVIGMIAGTIGDNLQTALQTPLALGIMSLVFILLGLSLFDVYSIQLPQWFENRLIGLSNHQQSGHLWGAAVMGCLATLILSPCVSPAFIGGIAYIAQTGHVFQGGLALFVMSLGMGLPLFLVALFGVHILPPTGPWMMRVKQVLGVLLFIVAILLINRIFPVYHHYTWSIFLIMLSVYLGVLEPAKTGWQKCWKGMGLFLAIAGGILLFHASSVKANQMSTPIFASTSQGNFIAVQDLSTLNHYLRQAKSRHQPVLIDFYASWCVACLEMDKTVFANGAVQAASQGFQRLRVDITHETPGVSAIKTRYSIIAPPTVVFLNSYGEEITAARVVGLPSKAQFMAVLTQVKDASGVSRP